MCPKITTPVPAAIRAFLPSRRPQERKKRSMKHRTCLEQHRRTHTITQEVAKTVNGDRNQEKATERRPAETRATEQQAPKCCIKSIHPELLGDTYVSQRLRKIPLTEVQTPMFSVSLEMEKRPGSDMAFEMSPYFIEGMEEIDCRKRP